MEKKITRSRTVKERTLAYSLTGDGRGVWRDGEVDDGDGEEAGEEEKEEQKRPPMIVIIFLGGQREAQSHELHERQKRRQVAATGGRGPVAHHRQGA